MRCDRVTNADPLDSKGPTGVCIPRSTCTAPNTIVTSDGGITSTCQCATGYLPNGAGGCVLAPSQRARMSRKQKKALVPRHPHAAKAGHQEVLAARPVPAKVIAASPRVEKDVKPTCPNGETACPLTSGGFECLDVASSLMSCEYLMVCSDALCETAS